MEHEGVIADSDGRQVWKPAIRQTCPSPLRFDATAPKPKPKAGKSALRFVRRPALVPTTNRRWPVRPFLRLFFQFLLVFSYRFFSLRRAPLLAPASTKGGVFHFKMVIPL